MEDYDNSEGVHYDNGSPFIRESKKKSAAIACLIIVFIVGVAIAVGICLAGTNNTQTVNNAEEQQSTSENNDELYKPDADEWLKKEYPDETFSYKRTNINHDNYRNYIYANVDGDEFQVAVWAHEYKGKVTTTAADSYAQAKYGKQLVTILNNQLREKYQTRYVTTLKNRDFSVTGEKYSSINDFYSKNKITELAILAKAGEVKTEKDGIAQLITNILSNNGYVTKEQLVTIKFCFDTKGLVDYTKNDYNITYDNPNNFKEIDEYTIVNGTVTNGQNTDMYSKIQEYTDATIQRKSS